MTKLLRTLSLIFLWLLPFSAQANDELITVRSTHSASVTIQRLHIAIILNDWTIFATIDHAAHAANFGVKIPARTTIAFGYMERWLAPVIERPTVAIEVPYRVLVWEDNEGVWITRDTLRYVQKVLRRHEAKIAEGDLRLREAKIAAMIDNVTR
jgi:uncharacterized protein (DUF302 family)